MGMSCTREQSVAMDKLRRAENEQAGYKDSLPGTYFIDWGYVGGKDYGLRPHVNVTAPVCVFASYDAETGKGYAHTIGRVTIAPDGQIHLPKHVKTALRLA